MTSRPVISVFDPAAQSFSVVSGENVKKGIPLPGVFSAPIRLDIVQSVHANLSRNSRQAHGVDPRQGHKHSAESWGTGRAVARIPRVSGSGTHRSGQGAFGNQCRKGRMFAPLRTYRRWHRRVNIKQKRHAVAAAIAASALVPLVYARGHKIQQIPELPLVVDDKINNYEKTKEVVGFFKRIGAFEDLKSTLKTRHNKTGRGSKFAFKRGPLIVYAEENVKLLKAVRNIPGVDICNVNRLNLLQLAPGGHLGRFIIWTASAFAQLNHIFGSFRFSGEQKLGYNLCRPVLSNADIARIINSNEVQSVIKPAEEPEIFHDTQKKNPLTNNTALFKLNPNAKLVKETARKANEEAHKRRQQALKEKRGFFKSLSQEQKKVLKTQKKNSRKWLAEFQARMDEATKKDEAQEKLWREEQQKLYGGQQEEVVIKKKAAPAGEKKEGDKKDAGKEGDKKEAGKEGDKKDAAKEPAKGAEKAADKKDDKKKK